jgi:DNA-binding MarR family transcriptional regulator
MGLTKSYLYSDDNNYLAWLFRTVAHPARLTILQYLLDHGSSTNKVLIEHLQLSQSTVSEHIKCLLKFKLIVAQQHETSMVYTIYEPMWNQVKALARWFVAEE